MVLVLRYQQYLEGGSYKTINKIIFRARLDKLYRIFHRAPFGNSGRLMLSFYDEALASYRDLKVQIHPKDTGEDDKQT